MADTGTARATLMALGFAVIDEDLELYKAVLDDTSVIAMVFGPFVQLTASKPGSDNMTVVVHAGGRFEHRLSAAVRRLANDT